MNDAGFMHFDERLENLTQEVPCLRFVKNALLSDVVEEVLAGVRPIHHDDKTVGLLEVVDQLNYAVNMSKFLEKTDLNWQRLSIHLHKKKPSTFRKQPVM